MNALLVSLLDVILPQNWAGKDAMHIVTWRRIAELNHQGHEVSV